MPSQPTHKLFQGVQVGGLTLGHRVVLAPLTRFRSSKTTHVPVVDLVKEYYSQRGSVPGTLLVTEATFIAAKAGGYPNVPGIWSDEQISAWKQVTDAVHSKKSFIFLQLWALGRAANPATLASEHLSDSFVAPSPIPLPNKPDPTPRQLSVDEIREYVDLYARAAENAVNHAGFDGVEIHGANGYLIDQFLQDVSNKRDDEYGGSIENRSRFGLEVVDAVVKSVGPERAAIRLSPWSDFQGMRMSDPQPQFLHFVGQLEQNHPKLAYLHVVEPRARGDNDRDALAHEDNDFLRKIWHPRPYISAGGYTRETAIERADRTGELIAMGRTFLANPDLPVKLEQNHPLNPYDRKTFYTRGDRPDAAIGYTDYPFANQPSSIPRL